MGSYPSSLTVANVNSRNAKKWSLKHVESKKKKKAGYLGGFVMQFRDFHFEITG